MVHPVGSIGRALPGAAAGFPGLVSFAGAHALSAAASTNTTPHAHFDHMPGSFFSNSIDR